MIALHQPGEPVPSDWYSAEPPLPGLRFVFASPCFSWTDENGWRQVRSKWSPCVVADTPEGRPVTISFEPITCFDRCRA